MLISHLNCLICSGVLRNIKCNIIGSQHYYITALCSECSAEYLESHDTNPSCSVSWVQEDAVYSLQIIKDGSKFHTYIENDTDQTELYKGDIHISIEVAKKITQLKVFI